MTDLIPSGATEKHIAFLGSTGSGKTSAAKRGLIEPALEAARRVIVLDPTGAWWGLRLAADGKRKGMQIYIFGGDHGDYPLRARDAALREHVLRTLPEGERRVLEALIMAYPQGMPRDRIDEHTGYKRSSRDAYLQRLSARELADTAGTHPVASANLFD